MKAFTSLLIAAFAVASLVGCGSKDEPAQTFNTPPPAVSTDTKGMETPEERFKKQQQATAGAGGDEPMSNPAGK